MGNNNSTLEALVNLIYLAKHSTGDPQKVVEYLDQAERHLERLTEGLREPSNSRRYEAIVMPRKPS